MVAGAQPFSVLGLIVKGAFGSKFATLETLNRALETRCLTSESVAEKIAHEWEMEHRGGQRVKGVADEVNVFELRGRKPS